MKFIQLSQVAAQHTKDTYTLRGDGALAFTKIHIHTSAFRFALLLPFPLWKVLSVFSVHSLTGHVCVQQRATGHVIVSLTSSGKTHSIAYCCKLRPARAYQGSSGSRVESRLATIPSETLIVTMTLTLTLTLSVYPYPGSSA